MRAEAGYLARPERIEDMARKDLKLEPIAPASSWPWKAIVADTESVRQAQAQSRHKDGIAALIEKASAPAGATASQ